VAGRAAAREASYHLVLHLDPDGQPYEVTGTLVVEGVAEGKEYTFEVEDGRMLACGLVTRRGMPDFFTIEADGVL
jgi:hypothetical protein